MTGVERVSPNGLFADPVKTIKRLFINRLREGNWSSLGESVPRAHVGVLGQLLVELGPMPSDWLEALRV